MTLCPKSHRHELENTYPRVQGNRQESMVGRCIGDLLCAPSIPYQPWFVLLNTNEALPILSHEQTQCMDTWFVQHYSDTDIAILLGFSSSSSNLLGCSTQRRLTAQWERCHKSKIQYFIGHILRDNDNKSEFISWITMLAFSSDLYFRIPLRTSIFKYAISPPYLLE